MSDDQQNMYVLGLRKMFNNSATTMLDTFNDILRDINTKSLDEPNNNYNVGVTQNWDQMNNTQQSQISRMYNFFCALNQLVSFAEVSNCSLKTFEET